MDRRTVVKLALASSIMPTGAFAQSSQSKPSAEAKHAADTLRAGALALETSRVAMKKASDAGVKRFAEFEAAEQETVGSVVKAASRLDPAAASPDDQGKAVLEALSGVGSGKSFDAAYVKVQVDGHQKLLQIQEAYLANGKDALHRSIAALARGQIKEHLANLDLLQRQLG
ncbi:DUF4142 domain-containing protein [Bosea sp. RCC_152_1]|uniref:DUF4142 domain-containing protein n=1 Tax=Bosea sp. RCC_152_1 TaxID=3239228 RepID=UPI0035231C57